MTYFSASYAIADKAAMLHHREQDCEPIGRTHEGARQAVQGRRLSRQAELEKMLERILNEYPLGETSGLSQATDEPMTRPEQQRSTGGQAGGDEQTEEWIRYRELPRWL